jgi:uncharacterized membrane protein YkoI
MEEPAMKKWNLLLPGMMIAIVAAFFALGYAAAEDEDDDDDSEESIAFSALPEGVRKTAEDYFGTSSGLEAEKEVEDGVTLYCVEGDKDGGEAEIEMTESGEIVEVERETEFAKLPSNVRHILQSKFSGAEFVEVEAKEIRFYDVKVKTAEGTKEVRISAAGKIEDTSAGERKLAAGE